MGPPNNWSKEEVDNNLFARFSTDITSFTDFDQTSIMLYTIPNKHTIGDYEVVGGVILSPKRTRNLFKKCILISNRKKLSTITNKSRIYIYVL